MTIAKFAGKCESCGAAWRRGDEIYDSGLRRESKKRPGKTVKVWICQDCHNKKGEGNMVTYEQFQGMNAAEQRRLIADLIKGTGISATEARKLTAIQRGTAWACYADGDKAEALAYIRSCIKKNDEKQENDLFDDSPKREKQDVPQDLESLLQLKKALDALGLGGGKVDDEKLRGMVQEEVQKQTKKIKVERWDGVTKDVGRQHHCFDKILKLVQRRKKIMLIGPAGSGKTTVCMNVAKALDLPFEFTPVNPMTTKTDLLGYMDANGRYVETALYRAYKNGGVFLLDEVDAANPAVLTTLNSLLENGVGSFPCGKVERHKDFIAIAAGNTFGRGADRIYIGRNQLDGATLDRFVNLVFDYDEKLERDIALSRGDDEAAVNAWVDKVQALRHAAFDLKERVVISPRASIEGADLLDCFDQSELLDMLVWKGIGGDIRQKIEQKAMA
jgi:MoxR-like ATPase/cytochrome c553